MLETFPTRPLPTTEGLNFALSPHPNWPVIYIFGYIRLLRNFPISQVAGCRCTLLAGNSSISLAGSEEQMYFSQQSPKMLKIASESFISRCYCFLKISRWVLLSFVFAVLFIPSFHVLIGYRKIPKISPGAYIFQRLFLRGLFLEGLIYGGKFAFQNRLG